MRINIHRRVNIKRNENKKRTTIQSSTKNLKISWCTVSWAKRTEKTLTLANFMSNKGLKQLNILTVSARYEGNINRLINHQNSTYHITASLLQL